VEEPFHFEEDVSGKDVSGKDVSGKDVSGKPHDSYLWVNAAWSMGTRLTDAFAKYGWRTAISGKAEGWGQVSGLPNHTFHTDDGTLDQKCPTEIGITDRRDGELDKLGFIPLCHYKNTDYAVFFAAQSINKPVEYFDPAASANADLMCQIPYVMAVSRFAHYLKIMQRDKLGSLMEGEEIGRELQNWIANYVLLNPDGQPQTQKAQKPLAGASVSAQSVPGKPGHYKVTFLLRPHFMVKKIEVSLRLVANLDQPNR